MKYYPSTWDYQLCVMMSVSRREGDQSDNSCLSRGVSCDCSVQVVCSPPRHERRSGECDLWYPRYLSFLPAVSRLVRILCPIYINTINWDTRLTISTKYPLHSQTGGTNLMKSQAKAPSHTTERRRATVRLTHSRAQEGGGARGRGRETLRANCVTSNIWTSRKTQAPARAQYSQPVWKLSRWGTGTTNVVTQSSDTSNNFQAQKPLCMEARTPLLELTPILRRDRPRKNVEIPKETWDWNTHWYQILNVLII